MYYSPSENNCYIPAIHGDNMPADVVEISEALFAEVVLNRPPNMRMVAGDDGLPVLAGLPAPTPEQAAKAYERAIQAHMDAAAVAEKYDDIKSAISYADEPAVAKFQADGKSFRVWRSLCWAYCYEQLAAVNAGQRSQPSIEDFIAELPPRVLP